MKNDKDARTIVDEQILLVGEKLLKDLKEENETTPNEPAPEAIIQPDKLAIDIKPAAHYPDTDEEMIVPKIETVLATAMGLSSLVKGGNVNYASPEFHTGEMSDALKNAGMILKIVLRDLKVIERL